jgi:hypothetical protein
VWARRAKIVVARGPRGRRRRLGAEADGRFDSLLDADIHDRTYGFAARHITPLLSRGATQPLMAYQDKDHRPCIQDKKHGKQEESQSQILLPIDVF